MDNSDFQQVSKGNATFTSNFYKILSESNKQRNIFFSPISAHAVLTMAYQGAAGETAEKFALALDVPNQSIAASGYNKVMDLLNNQQNGCLLLANKIYLKQSFALKSAFQKTVTELFLSEVESIDFTAGETAADAINQWVENKTNSKIKDVVTASSLDDSTRLILINAIYFKDNWLEQFKKHHTETEPFYVSNDVKVDCQMMHHLERFDYCENDTLDSKMLGLKYKNSNIRMIIILPNEKDGISNLECKIASVDLLALTKDMEYTPVNLSLPKFKIETTMDLKSVLDKMGLEIIFKHGANFSEISESSDNLVVDKVLQKTFIEVNEEGTEAAAVTKMKLMKKKGLPRQELFIVDHPFLFWLEMKDNDSSMILFYGKIVNPTL